MFFKKLRNSFGAINRRKNFTRVEKSGEFTLLEQNDSVSSKALDLQVSG